MVTKPESLRKFEESQTAKYNNWKTKTRKPDTRLAEQKAFDAYIATLTHEKVSSEYLNSFDQLDLKEGWYRFQPSTLNKPNVLPEACYGVMQIIYEFDDNCTGTQIIYPINESMKGRMFSRSVENNKSGRSPIIGPWMKYLIEGEVGGTPNITADATAKTVPNSVTASVHVTPRETHDGKNFTFDFQIPEGKQGPRGPQGPAGEGGGGTVTPIQAPKNELVGHDVGGEFGLNLFDYNEMSNDPKFRVSGHTFITNDKQRITQEPTQIKKLRVYNRIKEVQTANYKKKAVTIEAKLVESDESHKLGSNYDLESYISFTNKEGNVEHLRLQIPAGGHHTLKKEWENKSSYGYLQFQIGGVSKDVKGKINIDAYYGTIKPKTQDQKFVFKNYNGVDLYANGKGTYNIYRHMRLWDCVQENLNVVNLKDCKLVKTTELESKNMYLVVAPDDCLSYVGLSSSTQQSQISKIKQMFKENVMSSNLCDITAEDAEGTVDNSDKPFFIIEPTTHEVYVAGKGYEEKVCFQIIIGREYAYKWRNHLTQTQIIYPTQLLYKDSEAPDDLSAKNFTQLPVGGMIYILNNGQRIETNKYKEVIEAGTRGLHFKDSPFDYPDIIINYDNVASIIPNPYDRDDVTHF